MKIGVIGLGKLGSCLYQVLSEFHDVVGVDKDDDFSVLMDCEVVFNVVNTPSLPNGDFSNEHLENSIAVALPYLNCKVLVIVSTVMPGTCEWLSKRLPCKVCYNPEFIRLTSIIEDMKNPDFVLIGEEDKESGDIIEEIYNTILDRRFTGLMTIGDDKMVADEDFKVTPPIKRMDLKSAELAKISLNSYITMKLSFANTIGRISKRIGTDADKILDAIGEDHRIGKDYFKAGGAYGGPCFPRDNIAFSNVAKDVTNYALLTDKINKEVAKEEGHFSDDERYCNIN